jgi:adenosylhomocysteine nucleosidase
VRIGILAPMPSELRPVVKRLGLRRAVSGDAGRAGRAGGDAYEGRVGDVSVLAAMAGMGPDAAAAATRRMLDGGGIDHVVVVGIAGGIADGQAIGDVVPVDVVIDDRTGAEYRPHPLGDGEGADPGARPAAGGGSLHTSPEFIADAERVAALRAQGVVALDMETAAVAAVCEERGVPWSVFRTISDRASDGLADEAVFGLAHPDGTPDLRAVARFVVRHPTRIPHLLRLGRDMTIATKSAASAAATAIERITR